MQSTHSHHFLRETTNTTGSDLNAISINPYTTMSQRLHDRDDLKCQHIDETFYIRERIGQKLMNQIKKKYSIEQETLIPEYSTLPIESTRTIDYKEMYEEKMVKRM